MRPQNTRALHTGSFYRKLFKIMRSTVTRFRRKISVKQNNLSKTKKVPCLPVKVNALRKLYNLQKTFLVRVFWKPDGQLRLSVSLACSDLMSIPFGNHPDVLIEAGVRYYLVLQTH